MFYIVDYIRVLFRKLNVFYLVDYTRVLFRRLNVFYLGDYTRVLFRRLHVFCNKRVGDCCLEHRVRPAVHVEQFQRCTSKDGDCGGGKPPQAAV